MASCAHHLVLRDLPADAIPSAVHDVPPAVPDAVQFLLQRDRRQASASATRPALAPLAGRRAAVSPARGPRHARFDLATGRQ
ncbi:hypothetical protein G6F35_018959 [Rhizopus arrhizus]|nr:hypothetical protein G6F35_018959 [Rhizopus arrhizus]